MTSIEKIIVVRLIPNAVKVNVDQKCGTAKLVVIRCCKAADANKAVYILNQLVFKIVFSATSIIIAQVGPATF